MEYASYCDDTSFSDPDTVWWRETDLKGKHCEFHGKMEESREIIKLSDHHFAALFSAYHTPLYRDTPQGQGSSQVTLKM